MKAVIYARYSSTAQTEQSIEGQIRDCEEYAKKHGYSVVGKYIDRAISGKTDERAEFQRMMRDSGRKLFEVIICYKMDRFSRNRYDSAIYKAQLKKNGIKLCYAKESIPEGPEGVIMESLLEGMAEYYSLELAQKVKRGMYESALKCKHTGGPAPLGYAITPEKQFMLDENTVPIVTKIFTMYDEGTPVKDICDELIGMNVKTSIGGTWNKNSLRRILKNEKYIGVYAHYGLRIEGGVPAIVDEQLFKRVQTRIDANRRAPNRGGAGKVDYILSGKLYCGKCGTGMIGVYGTGKSGKKHYYYAYRDKRRTKSCDKKDIRKEWLENYIVTETARHILRPEIIDVIAKRCIEIHEREFAKNDESAFLKNQLADTTKALNNLMAAIEQGVVTKTTKSRLAELEQAQDKLEYEIGLCKAKKPDLNEKHIIFMLSQFARETSDESETYNRDIIECFLSKAYLYDDRIIITYNLTNENSELDSSELELLANGDFSGLSSVFDFSTEIDPTGNRTPISAVKGPCLNRLTIGPRSITARGII